ncbi:N-methyl-L-tryptophan oxidase [Neorhizobium sp. SOG26]|uniref:N-methyl-L-tryptophan oxidase n=1 Tax=Neorhizobium sp. SOG26 TaxID=2060726 RepID=UPI000E56A384|nr:N-methyl-L-tryptophan oxidase [Neorhizobium sp. SOG26]AXV15905.1 N-methyl-L-tryptophan oxidase [Neorhizobium sp. SOG26]
MKIHDVAVVGLGAMGAATLYQLAKRGVDVVGIDRFAPPHDQGSSHGDTRITRQAVGEGAAYVPLVANSHRIWREIEAELGVSLFEQCGVLIMTSSESPATSHHGMPNFTKNTIRLAQEYGIEHEVLGAPEIRSRFPQFAPVLDSAIGYFEPGGGYVRPEPCIDAQLTLAKRHGAETITGKVVTELRPDGQNCVISFADGEVAAKKVIVCAGMWSAELLGNPFNQLLRVCRQKLFWFKLAEPSIFPERSPTFILSHGPTDKDLCYGFPPIPGEGSMKVADEQFTVAIDPADLSREIAPEEVEEMFRTQVAGKIDGVTPELVKASVCTYTVTPDFGFIIDRHPAMENVTVVSACSGHGFKHSAAIGEAMAEQHVEGQSRVDLRPFSLKRFGY